MYNDDVMVRVYKIYEEAPSRRIWRVFMRFIIIALVSALVFMQSSYAEKVTYTKDIAPILFSHCVQCHRPDSVAPMSLLSYKETRPWAKSIREQVGKGQMPPWSADPKHGVFANDPSLSDEERQLIIDWVEQGAPQGNPKSMPETPVFEEGWVLGEPDYIITTPMITVPATGEDLHIPLRIPVEGDLNRWIRSVEIRPSNLNVAHHCFVFVNDYGERINNMDYSILAMWGLGTNPTDFPAGTGRQLLATDELLIDQHLHSTGKEETCVMEIGFYFGEGELVNPLKGMKIGDFDLKIPPHDANWETRKFWKTPSDLTIHSLYPHMHYRGNDLRFTAFYPDGTSEILLDVPDYDFSWQFIYYLESPKFIPKETTIEVLAHFDNSAGNPDNPDPSIEVLYGENSDEEMMFGIFEYTSAEIIDVGYFERQHDPESQRNLAIAVMVIGIGLLGSLVYLNGRQPTV